MLLRGRRPAFPQNALKEFAAQNGHFSVVLASLSVVTRFATLFSHYIMIIICNIFVRQHENNVHSHVTCFFVQGHWLPSSMSQAKKEHEQKTCSEHSALCAGPFKAEAGLVSIATRYKYTQHTAF